MWAFPLVLRSADWHWVIAYFLNPAVCYKSQHTCMQVPADATGNSGVVAVHGDLVVLGLGHGLVGIFSSQLPYKKPYELPLLKLTRPFAVLGMILVGVWQFTKAK